MCRVSVVVPIYNAGAGKKLDKCIRSILNQTVKEIELILVNDGSTDNSLDVCKKYQKQDSRIVIIDKKNEGSIAARRKGIEAAVSGYVMFVDADDWIDNRTVEILYQESTESSVDITVCNIYRVIGKGMIVKSKNTSVYFKEDRIFTKNEIMKDLVTAYFYGHPFPSSLCAKLYKKELLMSSGKYLDRIRFLGDDLYYNMEIFLKAGSVKVIDKPLYYYRVGGFTSKFMPYLFDDMINGYEIQKEVIDEFYQETRQKQYDGISIMLLNTLKTCLYNLLNGRLQPFEIKERIRQYVSHEGVMEALDNEGCKRYFSREYLSAIQNKDIEYLYRIGEYMYDRTKVKKAAIQLLSKFALL